MDERLKRITNEQLRDVPCDPSGLRQYIDELQRSLNANSDPNKQVSLLGEMGVHLRSLGDLKEAKNCLQRALQIIELNHLGIKREVQQKIRLGHVLQWEGLYDESTALFAKVISICRSSHEAKDYLDFALQHAGKNFFEQNMFHEALSLFDEALNLRNQRSAPLDQIESTMEAIQQTKKILGLK